MQLPSIPLATGKFSDTGYRFRKNIFNRNDEWAPFSNESEEEFYDILQYNSDTFDVGPEYPKIAEMYFRLNAD